MAAVGAGKDASTELCTRLKAEQARLADELAEVSKRETHSTTRAHDMELALERCETEHASTLADLRLALRRVDALSSALNDDLLHLHTISEDGEDDHNLNGDDDGDEVSDITTASPMDRHTNAKTTPDSSFSDPIQAL